MRTEAVAEVPSLLSSRSFAADATPPLGQRGWDTAVTDAIVAQMRADETVVLMGLEVSRYRSDLLEKFGRLRVIDTPISENTVVGMAVGAARAGLRPIVDLWHASFVHIAMDQIVNGLALSEPLFGLPASVVLKMRTGVPVRSPGTTHARMPHWTLAGVPGMSVVYPSCAADAGPLMVSALQSRRPTIFLEHIDLCKTAPAGPVPARLDVGQAAVVRPGKDVTVVALGPTVRHALSTAEELRGELELEVIDLRTLAPLDIDTVAGSVKATRRLVIVDEAPGKASFSWWLSAQIRAEVADMVCDPQCVTAPDEQVPYSPHGLAPGAIPQPADIVEAVRRAVTGHHEVDPTLKPVPAPGVTS